MARPLPRRRGGRDDAPDADEYAGRSRGRDDEPDEERRPRRGRGELPTSRRKSEPELPESKRALTKLSDDEWTDLAKHLDLDPDEATEDEMWEAIEALQEPDEPSARGRRGRSRDEDDEPQDEPRRGRRGRSEDDTDDEPRGRRGRSSRDDDGDDEPPARGRGRGRSRDDDEDDKPRGRGRSRSRDEDDEEDKPKRKPRPGFEGFKKAREQTFTGDFKLTPEELLVKFLEDTPFDTYVEHGLFQELNSGQRVWICIEDDCPICNVGHKGRAMSLWNIIVIPEEGEPRTEVLRAGPALTKELETKSALKTGPLSKEYYSLSQPETKKGEQPAKPNVEVVRERDVEEDWKFKPFTDAELDEFFQDCPDPETYLTEMMPTRAQLKGVAKQLRERD